MGEGGNGQVGVYERLGGPTGGPPPVQQKLSVQNLGSMLVTLLIRCEEDERTARVIGNTLDQVNQIVILLQHELLENGNWDFMRCPNCHKKVTWRKETLFEGTPDQTYVIHWRCETRRCAWYGMDYDISPPGRVKV